MKKRKKLYKVCMTIVLSLGLFLSNFGGISTMKVQAVNLPVTGMEVSSSYASGVYYQRLLQAIDNSYGINPAKRFVDIALSQEGYVGSTSSTSLAGNGNQGSYTEYGRYMGVPGLDWCAAFVSWCMDAAGLPTSVMPRSTGAGKWKNANVGDFHRIWTDDFKTYIDYKPQVGDLALYTPYHPACGKHYNSWALTSHVVIVSWVSDTRNSDGSWTFKTIERGSSNTVQRKTVTTKSLRGTSATCTCSDNTARLDNSTNCKVIQGFYHPNWSAASVWTRSVVKPVITLDQADYLTTDQVSFSWAASSLDALKDRRYKIEVKFPNGGAMETSSDTNRDTIFPDIINQVGAGQYTVTVKAIPQNENEATLSDSKSFMVYDPLTVPVVTMNGSVFRPGSTIQLSWVTSSAKSKLGHYWITIRDPKGNWAVNEAIDKSRTSYTYNIPSTAENGTYELTIHATPSGSVSGEGSETYTVKYTVASTLSTPLLSSVTNVDGGVKVVWQAVPGAENYKVFYKKSGGSWTESGCTTANSYTVKGLTSGVTYTFTVRCVSADKKTYTSSYDKTGKTITYLSVPNLQMVQNVAGGVKVTWNKVPGAENYKVFCKTEGGSWKTSGNTSGSSYTVTGLTEGITYTFTVRCASVDNKSYTSDYNKTGLSITYKSIGDLSTPVLSKVENVNDGVKVTWKEVIGAVKYKVFYREDGGKWITGGCTTLSSYTVKGLSGGKKYTFTVRCVSADEMTYTSSYDKTGKTIIYIKAPTLSSVSLASNGVKVTWTKSAGAEMYKVFYKTTNGSWKVGGYTTGSSYTVTGLTNGTTYVFTVRCVSADKSSYTSGYDSTGLKIKYVKP